MATTEETQAKLDAAREALDKAQAEHNAAARAAKPARDPGAIAVDLFRAVASRFGNHPDLIELIAELESTLAPPAAPPPAEAASPTVAQ